MLEKQDVHKTINMCCAWHLFPPPYTRGSTHMSSSGVESMISWNSDHSSLLPIPGKTQHKHFTPLKKQTNRGGTKCWESGDILLPMLTFLVSWETCTSIFRLSLLGFFLRFPARITSKSDCGRKPSLMGVTVAEGTEEVGVLDLLPVLLGVAATESDSDPSSLIFSGWFETRWGQETNGKRASLNVVINVWPAWFILFLATGVRVGEMMSQLERVNVLSFF